MAGYALLSAGIVVMAVGDVCLSRAGLRSWLQLDARQRAIFGEYKDMPVGTEMVLSLQLWSPIIGLIAFFVFLRSTLDSTVDLNISDLILALLYVGLFWTLFAGPGMALERVAAVVARRTADAMALQNDRAANEDRRRWVERFWRLVITVSYLLTGVSLASLADLPLPRLFGVALGLVLLQRWFHLRKLHLERCSLAEQVASKFSEDGSNS